jgi:hypothetical protein
MKTYDVVVIGTGPGGLVLAHACRSQGARVLLIDGEKTIGGCHRVRRVQPGNWFTEHGPRVYFKNFVTFDHFLRMAKLGSFEKYYAPHTYASFNNAPSAWDVLKLVVPFAVFLLTDSVPNESVFAFCKRHQFSPVSQRFFDLFCRTIDGAGPHKFSMRMLFELVNQGALHSPWTAYSPRRALDEGLLKDWKASLVRAGVKFELGNKVRTIRKGRAHFHVNGHRAKRVVIAAPPQALNGLLKRSGGEIAAAWGAPETMQQYTTATSYLTYFQVTLHYQTAAPIIAHNHDTPWGVIAQNIGFDPSIISCCASRLLVRSPTTHKSIHQTSDGDEVAAEMVRQLGIPPPAKAIVSPGMYRKDGRWYDVDSGAVRAPKTRTLPFASPSVPNLYCLGSYNGHSKYAITTIESAVSNAGALVGEWYPKLKHAYRPRLALTLRRLLLWIVLLGLLALGAWWWLL